MSCGFAKAKCAKITARPEQAEVGVFVSWVALFDPLVGVLPSAQLQKAFGNFLGGRLVAIILVYQGAKAVECRSCIAIVQIKVGDGTAAVRIMAFIRLYLIEQMFRLCAAVAFDIKPGEGNGQLYSSGNASDSLLQRLLGAIGGILAFVEACQVDVGLRVVGPDIDCSAKTFFRRAILRIEQLRQTQVFIKLRVVGIERDGLLEFVFRGYVLHLVQSNLAKQVVAAGILAVLLEHRFCLVAGLGILSRRDKQIPEVQAGVQIFGVEFDGMGEGLIGGCGMLLLDLQKSQAIIRIGKIRADLNGLTVFIFR